MSEPDDIIADALDRLRMEAARINRYRLTDRQEDRLTRLLRRGRDEWLRDGREDKISFSEATDQLVERFATQLPYNPALETKAWPQPSVPHLQQDAFEVAFRGICPLWPFC